MATSSPLPNVSFPGNASTQKPMVRAPMGIWLKGKKKKNKPVRTVIPSLACVTPWFVCEIPKFGRELIVLTVCLNECFSSALGGLHIFLHLGDMERLFILLGARELLQMSGRESTTAKVFREAHRALLLKNNVLPSTKNKFELFQ